LGFLLSRKPANAPNLFKDVNIQIPNADKVHWFLTSKQNRAHNQPAALAWLRENNPEWAEYIGTIPDDSALKEEIAELESQGKLRNVSTHPTLSAYVNPRGDASGGPGVDQKWRRTVREDHLEILNELNKRVNDILVSEGFPPEYFATTLINSTVRSKGHNSRIGGSPTSIHIYRGF